MQSPIPFKGKVSLFYLPENVSAQVLEQLEEPPPVGDSVRSAIHDEPWQVAIWRAEIYWDAEQDAAALRCCAQAIALAPAEGEGRVHALWTRSRMYEFLGKSAAAKADHDRAVAIDPDLVAEFDALTSN